MDSAQFVDASKTHSFMYQLALFIQAIGMWSGSWRSRTEKSFQYTKFLTVCSLSWITTGTPRNRRFVLAS